MSCEESTSNLVYVGVKRGDTLRLTVDLDAASGEVDITGWTFLCQVRDGTDALVVAMTTEVLDPAKGVLELSLTAAQTGAMTLGDFDWDLQATDTSADVRTLVSGKLRIREDVSHA